MRFILIFLALALVLAVPFFIWGGGFDEALGGEAAVEWLRGWGPWAPAAALILLISDIVLPVPATGVMAALGVLYGPVLGGALGAAGSILSGATAWGLCRLLGRRAALRLAGEKDLARAESFFDSTGGWAVALSRWLPILPEAVACLAGLARMKPLRFFVALACGSVPLAFAFAALGHEWAARPLAAVLAAALAPLALWIPAWLVLRRRDRRREERDRTT